MLSPKTLFRQFKSLSDDIMLCVVDGISYFFLFYMHGIFCQDFDGDVIKERDYT